MVYTAVYTLRSRSTNCQEIAMYLEHLLYAVDIRLAGELVSGWLTTSPAGLDNLTPGRLARYLAQGCAVSVRPVL